MWYQGNDDVRIKKCAVNGLRMREVEKKKSNREDRTTSSRSASKRLADCANRSSSCRVK